MRAMNGVESPQKEQKSPKHAKSNELKKVFICSPFELQGDTEEELDISLMENIKVAQSACKFAVRKGCIPYAPQLYFTQFLFDDENHQNHQDGDQDYKEKTVMFGLTWLARCDELWVFGEEVTDKMALEISVAEEWNIPIRWFVTKKSAEDRRKIVITVQFEEDDDDEPDEQEVMDFAVLEGLNDFEGLKGFEGLEDFDDDPDNPSDDDICSDCEFRDSCPNMN